MLLLRSALAASLTRASSSLLRASSAAGAAPRRPFSDDGPSTSAADDAGGAAPPPPRKRTRRPSRRDLGSWAESAELEEELEAGRTVPPGANIYDLQNTFPYFYEAQGTADVLAALTGGGSGGGGAGKRGRPKKKGAAAPPSLAADPPPPHPGARRIVQWETTAVLHAGPAGARHPAAAKVAARVHLADLAAEAGLSDRAARHVALVAGPRYNARSGVLRLMEARHAERADNAAALRATLGALVEEGRRRYPS